MYQQNNNDSETFLLTISVVLAISSIILALMS